MKKYTIATVVKVKNGQPWADRMEEGIKKFHHDTGHDTFLLGPPKSDENFQKQIVKEVIAQGVDALCVVPLLPQALELSLSKARSQGVVVISHEAPNQRNIDYELEAVDNILFGAHMMDHLARYIGQKGQYAVFLETLTTKSQNEWARAAVIRQQEKYPEMRLATKKIEHRDDRTLAREKIEELLSACPTLKGILCFGETATEVNGVIIEAKGLQDEVVVLGTGLLSKGGRPLLQNAIKLVSLWDPADTGYVMNKLAVMVLNGEPITDRMDLGVPGYTRMKMAGNVLFGSAMLDITKDNISKYTF